MAVRIEVEKSGNNVVLRAPEHPLLEERASALGGKVKGGTWTFPGGKEDQVRALARQLWGSDGREKDAPVTLRVELSLYGEGPLGRQGEAWLCGRLLARRRRFDAPVELGPDVKLVSGSFSTWGGSPGRPALGARYGTVVDVAGVPKAAAVAAEKDYPFEVKVSSPDAVVGAWSKTVTDRIPGPHARAEAKLAGKAPKAPKAEAPAAKAAPSAPPAKAAAAKPAPKAAPAPAAPAAKPAAKPVKAAAAAKAVKAAAASAAKAVKASAKAAKKSAKKAAKKAAKTVAAKAKAVAKKVKAVAKKVAKAAPKKATKKAAAKKAAKKAPKKAAKKAAPKKVAKKAAKKAAPKKATRKAAPKRVAKKAAPKKTAKKAARPAPKKKAAKRGRR